MIPVREALKLLEDHTSHCVRGAVEQGGSEADAKVEELRKGRSRVLESDHTLILGWGPKVFTDENLVPCHNVQNPFDFEYWENLPGFDSHHESRTGTYVEDCGGAGGNGGTAHGGDDTSDVQTFTITVVSVNDGIEIKAKDKIVLQAGQSSVTLEGGDITFACPGTFSVKGGQHVFDKS